MSANTSRSDRLPAQQGGGPLLVGGLAAILASTCCVGPLVLLTLGISGAWIANLTALEPYRPVFTGVALVALLMAWRGIWRPQAVCAPSEVCASPKVKRTYKVLFGTVVLLVVIALGFPYAAPWFY